MGRVGMIQGLAAAFSSAQERRSRLGMKGSEAVKCGSLGVEAVAAVD